MVSELLWFLLYRAKYIRKLGYKNHMDELGFEKNHLRF